MVSALTAPDEEDWSPEEITKFLDLLEKREPELRSKTLELEVDDLLGRRRSPVAPSFESPSPRVRRPTEVFAWYQTIARSLPAPMAHDRSVELARSFEAGVLAEGVLTASGLRSDSTYDARDLRLVAARGRWAYDELVIANLRLVFYWSKGVAESVGEDWVQDAFQVGCIGLMQGLVRWDYKLGFTVSTYVSWYIRQAIQRWRMNDVPIIRIPVHAATAMETDPSVLSGSVRESATRVRGVLSLDVLLEDLRDSESERVAWDGGLEETAAHSEVKRLLDEVLGAIGGRSGAVLRQRYGLQEGSDPATLELIGQRFGVTRERIRQIERAALTAVRAHHLAPSLREFA